MRVLLDECVPRKLKRELPGHTVTTLREMGWAGLKNGPLLALAADQVDAFITVDQNIQHQQRLPVSGLAIIIIRAESNDIDVLPPLMEGVRSMLGDIKGGDVRVVAKG